MVNSARTLPELFLRRVQETPAKIAFRFPQPAGDWGTLTWAQTQAHVQQLACGLLALGLKPQERCAILSTTRLEWILADLAIVCAGGATTTIYPSTTAEECTYIVQDSASRFIFAENAEQVEKLVAARPCLNQVDKVIALTGPASDDGWVMAWSELERLGAALCSAQPDLFTQTIAAVQPHSLATLIYTSGTTGRPKGVELTHDAWIYTTTAVRDIELISANDVQYLWLPLSHSFGKLLTGVQLCMGCTTAVDGRVPMLAPNLAIIRPTFMAAAPRIFEKLHNKILMQARTSGPIRYKIFMWSLAVGKRVAQARRRGTAVSTWLRLQGWLADRLVFAGIRRRFGGRLRFFVSGSAPLSREIAEFFHAFGIVILEGYGLTESAAASFVNRLESFRFGSAGRAFPGTEVKIAADGEILLRSRALMRGYHNLPEETRQTIDADGWLKTGDIGSLDATGFLMISERKKDLIKTSGGKYVAPQALESKLKSLCPYISQVVVHGNTRHFCTALVSLDEESIRKWAQENHLQQATYQELVVNPQVIAMLQHAVDRLNNKVASYESIKKFAVLPQDLSIEAGELTASLKVKRGIVENKYRATLDSFYTDAYVRH